MLFISPSVHYMPDVTETEKIQEMLVMLGASGVFILGPDIQVPGEEYASLESRAESGIHILCKCTLFNTGIKKGFGIIAPESLIA